MSKSIENALVVHQQEVAQGTYRLRLEAPGIAQQARAGQFAMVQVRDGSDPLLRRPFSFHRILAREGMIDILYRVVGRGTWMLSRCAPGTRLSLLGPLGNGFQLMEAGSVPLFIIAGGIGIAPLFELILRLLDQQPEAPPSRLHLFYGARTASELLPAETFTGLGISVHCSTDDGTFGYSGFVTQLLKEVAQGEQLVPQVVYACGPLAMQYHVAGWALDSNVPAQLSLESLMACGVGACLGCALPAVHPRDLDQEHYVHVCKDGPIFPAGIIQWHKIRLHQAQPPIFLYS